MLKNGTKRGIWHKLTGTTGHTFSWVMNEWTLLMFDCLFKVYGKHGSNNRIWRCNENAIVLVSNHYFEIVSMVQVLRWMYESIAEEQGVASWKHHRTLIWLRRILLKLKNEVQIETLDNTLCLLCANKQLPERLNNFESCDEVYNHHFLNWFGNLANMPGTDSENRLRWKLLGASCYNCSHTHGGQRNILTRPICICLTISNLMHQT